MCAYRRALCWVLRLFGAAALLAVVAAVMPPSWMDAIHRAAGLGALPAAPIVLYLTRTCSALYAFLGVITLLASTDLQRYAVLVRLLGMACLLFGPFVLVVDLQAGMPRMWTLVEGPWVTLYGVAILWLAARSGIGAGCPAGTGPWQDQPASEANKPQGGR